MRKICLAVLTFLMVGLQAQASPVGIANIYGAQSWESYDTAPYGMYSIALGTSQDMKHISRNVVPATQGAVYADGVYFVMEGLATSLGTYITNYLYDAETWSKITDFRGENIKAFDMAWDPTSGLVFGYFHNYDTDEEFLGTIDIMTGKTSKIADLPFIAYGLGCDVEGTLYAIATNGDLYRLDKSTGATFKIASTPCSSRYNTSGTIDSSTRTFYYACCNETETRLYGINIDTGATTELQVIPDNVEFAGLYLPEPTALPGAPAKVEDLRFDFLNGSLEGAVTFTLPTVLFSGNVATSEMNYCVEINGHAVTSSKGNPGSEIRVPLKVEEPGENIAKVFVSNETGSAPTVKFKAWIGPDTPAPVGTVKMEYDGNGEFTISWPEATSLHGGWFDPGTVTYNVSRYNSESDTPEKFTGLTVNSMTDNVPMPKDDEFLTYHYSVCAVFENTVGPSTSSDYYTIGSKEPPFYEPFDNRYDLGKFTIFEGEKKDWNRWSYDNKAVTLDTSGGIEADDYLLLPPLEFKAALEYTISLDAKGKYASDVETFEILAGKAPVADALTQRLTDTIEVKTTDFEPVSAMFIPESDGTYFIAIHATSRPYRGALTIDNIRVSEGEETGIQSLTPSEDMDLIPQYYTLQGVRVLNPGRGLYIELKGDKARKVIL